MDDVKTKNRTLLRDIGRIKLASAKLQEKNERLQKSLKEAHATLEGKTLVYAKLSEAHEALKKTHLEIEGNLEATKSKVADLQQKALDVLNDIQEIRDTHETELEELQNTHAEEVERLEKARSDLSKQLKDALRLKQRMKKLFVDEKNMIIRKYVNRTSGFFSNHDEDIDHLSAFLDFALQQSNN